MVRKGGLEPPRYCYRQPLKTIRLRASNRIGPRCIPLAQEPETRRGNVTNAVKRAGDSLAPGEGQTRHRGRYANRETPKWFASSPHDRRPDDRRGPRGGRPDHRRKGRSGHLFGGRVAVPRSGLRPRLRQDPQHDSGGLRRDHGRGRPAHRLRRADRITAVLHGDAAATRAAAAARARAAPASVCDGDRADHGLPLHLRRRATGARRTLGPIGRTAPGPERARLDGRLAHRRHPGRLRVCRPGARHRLDRRAARHPAGYDAGLRPDHRHAHGAHHRVPLPSAGQARTVEPRQGRARLGGIARGGGARRPQRGGRHGRRRAAVSRRSSWPYCRS